MKLKFTQSVLIGASLALTAPAVEAVDTGRTFYFDFGATPNGANKCELTVSPDTNGNYWNNITNTSDGSKYADKGTIFAEMIAADGAVSALSITLNDRFSTNGMKGGGGLLQPDAHLLGDLAVASATADYFFYEADQADCSFTVGGLDADKAYKFYIFASRSATDNRTGIYRLSGYNLWSGNLQAAGSNIGGAGINQNNSTILESDYVFADSEGNIRMTISRASGTYIPLNCMKIEEYADIDRPAINNFTAISLSGSAIDKRKVRIEREMVDNVFTNKFTGVADFTDGEFKITATDDNGNEHTFGINAQTCSLVENGSCVSVSAYPTLFEVDFDAMSCSLTPIENIRIIGSAVGSWSLNDYKEMNYDGDLVFTWEGELEGHDTSTDSGRIGLYINGTWTAFKRHHIDADYNAVLALNNGADIPVNPGSYKIDFNLDDMVLRFENAADQLDPNRITVFGSSVANGQGADRIDNENHGYMYLYGRQLSERSNQGLSDNPFYVSNISIGGNSTVMLLNRYDDMRREFGKYVVFGVSLGNEGIHESKDKKATYNQFKDNMLKLISMVRADGKVPVVCNNYTRGDFTEEDYSYILEMDKEIGLWDMPSINLLGAIDSKTGRWADGYQNGDDIYHPNQAGHEEFAYAMVPSLFDALASGKTLCNERIEANGADMSATTLSAEPEGTMHSFALVTIGHSEAPACEIAAIRLCDGSTLSLAYINGQFSISDGQHTATVAGTYDAEKTLVALSYTYASKVMDLEVYADKNLLGRARLENIICEPEEFTLGNCDMTLCEAMIYRSALSSHDVTSLAEGQLQKSSLEIYSTFDDGQQIQGNESTIVENHAMSLNAFVSNYTQPSGINEISRDSSATRYFTIDGLEASNPVKGHFYIALTGATASKVVFE